MNSTPGSSLSFLSLPLSLSLSLSLFLQNSSSIGAQSRVVVWSDVCICIFVSGLVGGRNKMRWCAPATRALCPILCRHPASAVGGGTWVGLDLIRFALLVHLNGLLSVDFPRSQHPSQAAGAQLTSDVDKYGNRISGFCLKNTAENTVGFK